MHSDDESRAFLKKESKDIKPTLVNNNNCQIVEKENTSICRPCPPTELLKNGGFEEIGVFDSFAYWLEDTDGISIAESDLAYEGRFSAQFGSTPSANVEIKTAEFQQWVTVTPGCFLVLSFADNFLQAGDGFRDLKISAKVFQGAANFIDIEYDYDSVQARQGYVFHQKVSDVPIPFDVTSVSVEFFVEIEDQGTTNPTFWLLDGVSLRAI